MRKIIAFVLSGALILALFGCGDKTVDYSLDGDGDSSTLDDGTLASEYNIPEECNESIDVGASALEKIVINVENVLLPDTASMNIVYFMTKEFNNETRSNLAETIFDKDEGIYKYDGEGNSVELDLQAETDQNENDMETAVDYSDEIFSGMIDGTEYGLLFSENHLDLFIRGNLTDYRPLAGADENISCYCASSEEFEVAEIEKLENMCPLSENEALSIAEEFMAEIGLGEMILTQTDGLYWSYYGTNTTETDTIELDGYTFLFSRAINNTVVSKLNLTNVDNLAGKSDSLDLPTEEFIICVDSNGIIEARGTWYFEATGDTEEQVELLSFDELLDAANENISEYYVTYPTNYTDIEFNKMELTYFLEETDEEGVFKYVPAWILSQFDANGNSTNEEYPYQTVVMDAADGSVIDLLSLSNALVYDGGR